MHDTLQKWLDELDDEISMVESSNINEEAQGNLLTFGVPQSDLDEWGQDSLAKFIVGCRDLYKSKSGVAAMKFYAWYDEQAGQLRISAVSTSHNKLPFGCQITKCELQELVQGLFTGNSGHYDEDKKLKVWQSSICPP